MSVRRHRRVAIGAVLLIAVMGCRPAVRLEDSDHPTVLAQQLMRGSSPSARGSHAVLTLTYGRGDDTNRPEYGDGVAIKTEPVDASSFIDLGDQAESRNRYWGFTPEEFPLNGRVWYPDGAGPFPLVLVVHGNHDMRDFSDPGYAYLGEMLASRGYVLASLDMNFVNGGIRQENDARGWLLLKHLEAWRGFVEDTENPFFSKVDMGRIGLIGHSRGGEAVGHAAAFNRLRRYPDDGNVRLNFGFDIKAIIAIAPVDGQYLPTDRFAPVKNVNYMVLHGSHDGDVTSFHGLRLYKRVEFTDGLPHLKAAIYVYRANHGQWNTVWGAHDRGPRSGRILDLRGLLDPDDQREIARIYISAFLEYSLRDNREYLPLFRDHRVAGGWLPKTMYVTRFEDHTFRPLASFEEDIDVTTGSVAGVTLMGDSLGTWRERELLLRSRNRPTTSASQVNQAAWLGWNRRVEGSGELGRPASFTVSLPDTLGGAWRLSDGASLQLSLTAVSDRPGPREAAKDGLSSGDRDSEDLDRRAEIEDPDGEDEKPVDLSIELVDAEGRSATVALSLYGPIRRPLETRVLRRRDLEEERFGQLYELVLHTYSIPLADFRQRRPSLELRSLAEIRLVFDRTEAGAVVVDDVGISFLDPAFTSARIAPDTR